MRHPVVDDVGRPGAYRGPWAPARSLAPVTRGMAKIGIESSTPIPRAANTFKRKFGLSTAPANANFGLRSASKIPQYGPDAAFVCLPGLIERLDDRIIDAHGVGAGDEIADHLRLRRPGTASLRFIPALGQPNSAITIRLPG